ncbi:MAG: IS256 family transposase, partial [Deltaproteobacteria bacterium]|nr:IS256 family transposase [Deltaproteobacteria bacterium]
MLLAHKSDGDLMGPNGLMRELSGALISRIMEAELTHELDYESGEEPPEEQTNRR